MAGKSPSQRTLEYLRGEGWPNVQSVEKWIPQAKRRKDLFRFADILAMHPEWGHLYVQATTGSHVNARLQKMLDFAEDQIEDALACGARVEVHGWRKLQGRGSKKWFPIVKDVTLEVLHKMNEEQWQVVRECMTDIWHAMPEKTAQEGALSADVVLFDYPPGIQVVIHLDAGSTDRSSPDFTPKELRRASELAAKLCQPALAEHEFLILKKARYLDAWELGYVLRPEVYELVPGVKDVK
jgi:hypothetical protein